MTEEQIERAVERKMDWLDGQYLNSDMTLAEYDAHVARISQWADLQYRAADRR
jgi:hypothetical protein